MNRFKSRKTLAVAAAAVAVAGGGGAAIAAGQGSSPSATSFFDDVAKHLGISSEKLEDATKAAAIDQVDAALEAGRITQAQADELKKRIESGDHPPFLGPFLGPAFPRLHAGPHLFGPHLFGPQLFGDRLAAAADYLGLSEAELRDELSEGQTLAEIARAHDKSVDGLEQAIVEAAAKRLDQAVDNGMRTQAEADGFLRDLKVRIDDFVNNAVFHWRFRGPLGDDSGARAFW